MKNNQTIGLMLVVRNEIERIRECLEWHLPYVDAVVVCDQQSDDGTWEVLKDFAKHTKKPFKIWQDKQWGFCEPSKQATADLLKTDWLLYLDPDEKFPVEFLRTMHSVIEDPKIDGYNFPRNNFFEVQVYDDNVPIKPKWITIHHPAVDFQLRLTRKSVSYFPEYLHHRVRLKVPAGAKVTADLLFPIEHKKKIQEQWNDQQRYDIVNRRGK